MKFYFLPFLVLMIVACNSETGKKEPVNSPEPAWTLAGFVKTDSLNPILTPDSIQQFVCPVSKKTTRWEARNVLNPSAVVKEGKVYLLYRAQDKDMTSRLGLAISEDGLHFTKQPQPVFYPALDNMNKYEWKGGVEDPRLIEAEDGTYILTYTAYDGKTARLCLATSKDLLNWSKQGLVLNDVKYKETWSKSGAIVARLEGNRIVATKIKGKYWMYFGDTDLFLASSDDLIHWTIAEDEESGRMIRVLSPRPGYFDSRLVEPGPYALLQNEGILLIYNGSNEAGFNDSAVPKFTYSAGQALFDKNAPYKMIARTATSFIKPDKPYEHSGEVNEVCFVEGLVYFKNKWLLYYGTADSKIAVAVRESK